MSKLDKGAVVDFLKERLPGHKEIAYQIFADRLGAAIDVANEKMQAIGIDPASISREQFSVVLDWCFRLAFNPEVDQAILKAWENKYVRNMVAS